jgi:hypothetical protein
MRQVHEPQKVHAAVGSPTGHGCADARSPTGHGLYGLQPRLSLQGFTHCSRISDLLFHSHQDAGGGRASRAPARRAASIARGAC